jgi:hypothetical protein|tara:strand:+ start:120 stop:470 length:351 start_codon:yes stop_codon:yes gene_type:complete
MIQIIIKILLSSGIIVLVSEIAKKNSFLGGLIASIPLVSILAMIWLYLDTKNVETVSALSTSILWLVIPSLALFISLPILLKSGIDFYMSLGISILITMGCYWVTILLLGKMGIKL